MNINLDGRPLDENFVPGETLQQFASRVREKHLRQRMVVSIAFDGRTLLEEELVESLNKPVAGVDRLDLVSAEPGTLVASAFREVASQLADTGDRYESLADEVQGTESSKAISQLGEFLTVWQTCQKAILEGSGMLASDLTALNCDGRTVREHLDTLSEKLRGLRGAFEAGDMVLLSDQLRYEMPEVCRTWDGVMRNLAGQVAPA